MTALAAARLGYRCHVFANRARQPGGAGLRPRHGRRRSAIAAALERFAAAVDVATFEFENIPAAAVRRVAAIRPVLPRPEILEIAQDRLREKDFLRSIGVATTANYREIADAGRACPRDAASLACPAVLKTVRMGYDGKGQVRSHPDSEPEDAWRRMGGDRSASSKALSISACEISVIVARGADGALAIYPPVENQPRQPHPRHDDRAGATSRPTPRASRSHRAPHRREARSRRRACGRDVRDAEQAQLLVNELAPRPHNSGHWTIDACVTSQFEQLVRAICGLPLAHRAPLRRGDEEPARARCRALARSARRPAGQAAPLRQDAGSGRAARWATSRG